MILECFSGNKSIVIWVCFGQYEGMLELMQALFVVKLFNNDNNSSSFLECLGSSWFHLLLGEDTTLGEVLVCFSLAAPSATLVAEHSDVCLGSGWKDNALLFP